MANREELGDNVYENRRHWNAAERFRRDLLTARGELGVERPGDDWRETRVAYMGEPDVEIDVQDSGLSLSDDLEFEDTAVVDHHQAESDAIGVLYTQQVMCLAH